MFVFIQFEYVSFLIKNINMNIKKSILKQSFTLSFELLNIAAKL